ncbi:unnamed protein product [Gadus morhua 'NCC']
MSEPQKRMGYLTTEKHRKQVIVIKHWSDGKALKAKSVQLHAQYKATIYEWDMQVAFSFNRGGQHCFLKVGKDLELVEPAEENLPNILGEEYRFRWEDNGTRWRRLEHQKDNVVKLLCCNEEGNIFLTEKSSDLSRPEISDYLWNLE